MSGAALYPALFAQAETTLGHVRGTINAGVRIFRGVPYGRAERFRLAGPPPGWAGVRDCFAPGSVAPQVATPVTNAYARLIQFDRAPADGGIGEDCLTLNVHAPAHEPGISRPVVVVIHGGGFAIGSGNAPLYDGTLMALEHGVVVVAINHRLNAFGFCALDRLGADERFDGAGVAGLADLVLGLRWVRDNAAAFGGDPARVTLIGQSGGGWKISTLLAMPSARGLFHRAIVQSGSWPVFQTAEAAAALVHGLLGALGLGAGDWSRLLDADIGHVLAAQVQVGALAFQPSLDPAHLPWQPDDPRAQALGADVPLIISTTREDAGLFFDWFDLTWEDLALRLSERFGDAARTIMALYRGRAPTPYLTWARIVTDGGFRRFAHAQADARGTAPTWLYRWDHDCPAWQGRYGAAHAMDVPASLARPDDPLLGGATRAAVAIAARHAGMVARFAATGTAAWDRYDPARRACLLVDTAFAGADDPDGECRRFWDTMPMPDGVA